MDVELHWNTIILQWSVVKYILRYYNRPVDIICNNEPSEKKRKTPGGLVYNLNTTTFRWWAVGWAFSRSRAIYINRISDPESIVFYTSFNENTLPSLNTKEIGPGLRVDANYDPPATSLSKSYVAGYRTPYTSVRIISLLFPRRFWQLCHKSNSDNK